MNFNDQLVIFGGATSNLPSSGVYNDSWTFDYVKKFKRMTTVGTAPSPRANFGMLEAGQKIIVLGGRSSSHDTTDSHQFPFEVFLLNPHNESWTKVNTTGVEPQYRTGVRGVMISSNELVVVGGLIPRSQNWTQEFQFQPDGQFEHFRTSMQVSLLKFSNDSLERGSWHRLAEWQQNRRGFPMPRGDFHLAFLGNDHVVLCGGKTTNHIIQDVWILKITRQPSYNLRFIQVTIENPLLPALPLHIFPSCLIGDLLVFTGVRTIMKKPGVEKPREEQRREPEPAVSQPSPSFSVPEKRVNIFINHDRPVNTIGAMAAFSVSSQPAMPPQKFMKIQAQAPDPPPELPKKLLQDYPMRIFCLDLSCVMNPSEDTFRTNPTVRWLDMKNSGLFPNAPELRAHGTLTQLDNGLVLIGGVRRSQTDDDVLFTQATNEVYALDYIHEDNT